jgi:hypothetical protein
MTVTLYGTQGECKPFLEHAKVGYLGERSARLDGIAHIPAPGDIVGLEYNHRQATVRILWVCERENPGETEIAVQLLSSEPCPWQQDLDAAGRPCLV